jgi:broad specificity phosphatase PhoE
VNRLPGARLRQAQIATLATFVAMGHAALSSVACLIRHLGNHNWLRSHRFNNATFVRVEIDYEIWL